MALVLVTDPSLAGFNGYCTVAEVTDYETSKGGTTYAAKTTAQKEALIIWATRQMDVLQWKGWKTDPAQNHEWPRSGVWRDGSTYDWSYSDSLLIPNMQFDATTIPQFLKDATADLVLQLNVSDTTAATGTEGYKRIKVSEIELEIEAKDRPSWFQESTRSLCWRYLRNSSKYSAPTVRVG